MNVHDWPGTVDDMPPAGGPILACVAAEPSAVRLVRTAFRLADRAGVPWTVLHVETPAELGASERQRTQLDQAMALAESLGAEIVTSSGGRDVATEILNFARTQRFNRIVIGRGAGGWLRRSARTDIAGALLRDADTLEVTVVANTAPRKGNRRTAPHQITLIGFDIGPFVWALAAVAIAGLLAFSVEHVVPLANLSLLFLTAVLVIGGRFGTKPALFAAAVSLATYNFFFTEPYYTFFVHYQADFLTLVFFLSAAVLAGHLAGRIRAQLDAVRVSARRNAVLYDFSRKVAAASGLDDVLWTVCHHVAAAFDARSLVLLPEGGDAGTLAIKAGYPPQDHIDDADWTAANTAWRDGRPSGAGVKGTTSSEYQFIPLRTRRGPIGLIGIAFESHPRRSRNIETRDLLEAVASQSAIAIERAQLAHDLDEARMKSETDNLRSALLSSISHDLRTPLVSVIGSATTLKVLADEVSISERIELVDTILEEAQRLNRFVQNLLDMTRLGYGALQPRRDWVDLREVVGVSVHRLRDTLASFRVQVILDEGLPLLYLDPVLMEQVFVNLLDNAAKYSPEHGSIAVSGKCVGECVGECVEIGVTDEGPGVPEAERELVFKMFYRVRSGDQADGGTGLGLAICKGLVEAHGGQIRAESGPDGRGAAIVVVLPVDRMPTNPELDRDEEDDR